MSMSAALFLDRDGVVNVDTGYVHLIEELVFVDGIFDLAREATGAGFHLVIVTNQAGIGRGLYSEEQYQALTSHILSRFVTEGAPIAKAYHCPYHPELGIGEYRRHSDWRKPEPGMLLQAQKELGLDLGRSMLVGDRSSDIEAARRAGVGRAVLFTHAGSIVDPGPLDPPADHHLDRHEDVLEVFREHAREVVR